MWSIMQSSFYLWNTIEIDGKSDGVESVESDNGSDKKEWDDEREVMGRMDVKRVFNHRYTDIIISNY